MLTCLYFFAHSLSKLHRLDTTTKNRAVPALFLFIFCRVMQCTTPCCNLARSQSTWLGTGVLSQWLRNLTSITRTEKQIFHFSNSYIIASVLPGKLIHNQSVMCPISKPSITDHWWGQWNDTCWSTLCSCNRVQSLMDFGLFAPTLWKYKGRHLLLW